MNTDLNTIDINTLQIPENINQFGKTGFYPISMINEFYSNYCIYCGDLFCPCSIYMNETAKRSIQSYNNNNDNSNNSNNISNNNSDNTNNNSDNTNNNSDNTNNSNNTEQPPYKRGKNE
jgi:hypothetical protein